MNWRTFTTLALLAGALLAGWALWNQRDRGPATGAADSPPDYILNDFELIALDSEGQESFTLRAPRLERDPDSKTLDIITPVFVIPSKEEGGHPWEVRSRTGWVSAAGDEIRLRDEVEAVNGAKDDETPTRIATEQLDVFPEARRATSPVKVTVTQPGLIMNGRELVADLERNQITLKDTRTRYENTR